MKSSYKHPTYTPSMSSDRSMLFREHPQHGVRVNYYTGRAEYVVVELEYYSDSDQVGHVVGIELVTNLHSEVTERIDQVFESYLVPARLSEMMEEFVYRS